MWTINYDMNLSIKQNQTHRHRKWICGSQGGLVGVGKREGLGVWD